MCPYPIYLYRIREYVPCGKCGSCVKRWISDWSIRCKEEMKVSTRSFFVTLTYEVNPLQLYKKDLQDFFKRLRKAGFDFSYLAIGDYGDKFGRPHYHVLFFVKGFFEISYLSTIWALGSQVRKRGFVDVLPLTAGRIGYVVKYVRLARLDWPDNELRTKPFMLTSRNPAIGLSYVSANMKRWHKRSNRYYPEFQYKRPLPRYYRNKIFTIHDLELSKVNFSLELQLQRDNALAAIRAEGQSVNPFVVYVERSQKKADQYLEELRSQKAFKKFR